MRRFGTIPWLRREGKLRIVVVKSKDGDRWVLPKGRPEPGMSKRELAALEAWEEAGIRGAFRGGDPIDVTLQRSAGAQTLRLYPLRVDALQARWPERRSRTRRVVSPKAARKLLSDPGMRRAVARFADRMG